MRSFRGRHRPRSVTSRRKAKLVIPAYDIRLFRYAASRGQSGNYTWPSGMTSV
ncbi:MAG: hypothetical protein L0Z73_05170 [Gammaproteobacteria bacterium]|nr:hypothetical protein [Gammaproteobacteria bacterium]